MRIFVFGATGVLGRALLPRLQQARHDIRALARSSQQAQALQAAGIEATVGDGLQAETQQQLPELIKGCEAVIHIATAIPSDLSVPGAWETTTRLRTEGTRHLLDAALQAGVTCYLQQSIVMAYPDSGDAWLDEDQPLDTAQARPWISGAVIEMERMVRAVPPDRLRWIILRGGQYVGPGTGQEKLLERLRMGQVEIPGRGQRFLWLCCKKLKEDKMSMECLCLFSLSNHSEQLGNQYNLTSHVSLCHALHLSLAYHVHHLKSLQGSPGCLEGEKAHCGLC